MARLPITLPDYERLFRTVHGVLLSEDSVPEHACQWFSFLGASVLRSNHKLDARMVAGCAGFNLNGFPRPVVNADPAIEGLGASWEGFHAWIEVGEWIIDLQAPLFRDVVGKLAGRYTVPRYMFQKPKSQVATVEELERPGSFWFRREPEFEATLEADLRAKAYAQDIESICVQWHRRLPREMRAEIATRDSRGTIRPIRLSPLRIDGVF